MILNKFQLNSTALRRITVFCLLAFLAGCSSKSKNDSPSKQAAAVPVKVAKVEVKEMPVEINSIGNIEPVSSVEVKSQATGKLLKVNFKQGDYVRKGQLLFTLDSRPFVQSVNEAQANLKQSQAAYNVAQANLSNARAQLGGARSNVLNQQAGVSSAEGNLESLKAESDDALSLLKKQQALFSEGIIAERDLEVARTGFKSAAAKYEQAAAQVRQAKVVANSASSSGIEQAQAVIKQMESQIRIAEAQIAQNQAALDNAKIQLDYCRINSPIDGRTGNLIVTQGNLVNANDSTPLVTINNMSPIYATFSVPEKYLPEIRKYDSSGDVKVVAQIDPNTRRAGTLSSIDNEINRTTGTLQLKASFQNDDNLLFPGSFVNIVLTLTDQPDAKVVPAQAVQTSQQGQFVYVVKADQTVEMRKIVPDRTIGDETVISEGLSDGETVVTDGQLRVSPGTKVQIIADSQTGSNSAKSESNSNPQNRSTGGLP